jgi:hypothetical protein
MMFALVVMAGVLLLVMVVNNRREPSRWDGVWVRMGRWQHRERVGLGIRRRFGWRLGQ